MNHFRDTLTQTLRYPLIHGSRVLPLIVRAETRKWVQLNFQTEFQFAVTEQNQEVGCKSLASLCQGATSEK